MNQLDQQLEAARDHIRALRLEASRNRDLQLLGSRANLRCWLARILRNWAANLERETAKPATSS